MKRLEGTVFSWEELSNEMETFAVASLGTFENAFTSGRGLSWDLAKSNVLSLRHRRSGISFLFDSGPIADIGVGSATEQYILGMPANDPAPDPIIPFGQQPGRPWVSVFNNDVDTGYTCRCAKLEFEDGVGFWFYGDNLDREGDYFHMVLEVQPGYFSHWWTGIALNRDDSLISASAAAGAFMGCSGPAPDTQGTTRAIASVAQPEHSWTQPTFVFCPQYPNTSSDITATDIASVVGFNGVDQFSSEGTDLASLDLVPGDTVRVSGFTEAANNGDFTVRNTGVNRITVNGTPAYDLGSIAVNDVLTVTGFSDTANDGNFDVVVVSTDLVLQSKNLLNMDEPLTIVADTLDIQGFVTPANNGDCTLIASDLNVVAVEEALAYEVSGDSVTLQKVLGVDMAFFGAETEDTYNGKTLDISNWSIQCGLNGFVGDYAQGSSAIQSSPLTIGHQPVFVPNLLVLTSLPTGGNPYLYLYETAPYVVLGEIPGVFRGMSSGQDPALFPTGYQYGNLKYRQHPLLKLDETGTLPLDGALAVGAHNLGAATFAGTNTGRAVYFYREE